MDRYSTKRRLLRPLTAWRRWRAGPLGPLNRAFNEALDYRPSLRRFLAAARADPDLLVDVDLPEGAVVLDVGAYEGTWTTGILGRAGQRGPRDLLIHAFEPEPSSIERFREAHGDDPRVHLHPYGLAGRDRLESMSVGGPGTSVFKDSSRPGALGTVEAQLRDVDAVLRSLGVERVDLVKVNIEGGEFELLDRLHETGWLPRTGALIIQFHEFGPDAHRARRRNRRQLAETHRCTWCYPWVYERWDAK